MEFDRSAGNMSMREKSLLKRRINREHNSNFRAGYININENYLQKTGLRGRKRYFLYCVVFILILVALLNALLTAGIIYILRFSWFGTETLEFVSQNKLVRFLVDSSISSVNIIEGELGGRSDSPLMFYSNGGPVKFKTLVPEETEFSFATKETVITTLEDFRIVNSKNGKTTFSTQMPSLGLNKPTRNLKTPSIEAANIQNLQIFDDLYIETYNTLNITGLRDVEITSNTKPIDFHPGDTISVLSRGGNLILDAAKGIFVDTSIPLSRTSQIDLNNPAYKICVCLSDDQSVGRLFIVEVNKVGDNCGSVQTDASICPS